MDIFKEEKFEKGGVILERIHPDLQVEPYVPYYERMGYVVSIVEKPNGWVELIGEKKDTFEDAYGRFKNDIRKNTSPRKMAKGGSIDEIISSDLYQQLRDKDMFKLLFSTKPKMRKLFNAKNTDSFGRERPYGIAIGEGRDIFKYYYPIQEYRDDDFETAKKIIASFYNEKFAKGGEIDDTILVKPRHASRENIKDLYDEVEENMYEYKTFKAPNNEADYISITPDNFSERNRITEYLDNESWEYEEYARGGRTKIENDGVDFNEEMYKGILGDKDKDGTENADDLEPSNPNVSKNIEGTKFTDTFRTLLGDKRTYDDSMYSIIGEMEKILPQKFDIIARTKTPFSILKKLVEKRLKFKRNKEGKVTNKGLTDVVGTTIATNNTKELMTLRKMIGVDDGDNGIFGEVIEVDDKFKIPACGYRAIHYIVLYNGAPVEIQLKTKRMKMLNEFTHPFYKAGDLDCDGMGELAEIVVMADNGSKEAQKEFTDIFADKDLLRSMVSKSFAKGGEVEWFDYSKIDLEELPYDLDRYFIKDADTKEIDLKLLEPTRAREKGVKNANKYMRMAYDGEIDRRKPISVYERNGKMFVFDGNSTIANAKNSGWKTIYVEMIDDPMDDFEKGGRNK